MKIQAIDHPQLGLLVPDGWNSSLICFRQILSLKAFVEDGATSQLTHLNPSDRKLVESWQTSPAKLVPRCRDTEIFTALRELGVFEISYGKTPTPEQVATWNYFVENEASICRNIWDALLRYYKIARARDEDWFDDWDCPEIEAIEELRPLATLDGVSISSRSCEGLSVMELSWKVEWDMEHGFSMLVWRDQIIGINLETLSDILVPEMLDLVDWNSSVMTPLELEYQERVRQALLSDRQGEDEDE